MSRGPLTVDEKAEAKRATLRVLEGGLADEPTVTDEEDAPPSPDR